jgi:hypothetical protein
MNRWMDRQADLQSSERGRTNRQSERRTDIKLTALKSLKIGTLGFRYSRESEREREREKEIWGEREREAVVRENGVGHLRRWRGWSKSTLGSLFGQHLSIFGDINQ